jgi:predicted TIM-barrel fold metal-dependent hydrolase
VPVRGDSAPPGEGSDPRPAGDPRRRRVRRLGRGEDKIIYGSEAPLWHPQSALRTFKDFQIPEEVCAGYGYPQLTEQAKRKILGENLLRPHGMDLAEAKARAVR